VDELTRTKRAYNKRPIYGGPGFKGWIASQKIKNEDLRDPDAYALPYWIGYDPYRQLCMGHCPSCKKKFEQEKLEREAREKLYSDLEIEHALNEV